MAYTYRSPYRLGRDRQAIAVQLTAHVEVTSTFKPRWVLWRLVLGFQPRTFFLVGTQVPRRLAQVPKGMGGCSLSSRPCSSWGFTAWELTICSPTRPLVCLLEKASSLSLDEACTMLALREGAVQRCGHSLLLSFPDRSLSNVTTMGSIYQMFSSAQQLLDQQFPR